MTSYPFVRSPPAYLPPIWLLSVTFGHLAVARNSVYFRLDYNEFYATHSATLLSDNTMMAGGASGASADNDGDGYQNGY